MPSKTRVINPTLLAATTPAAPHESNHINVPPQTKSVGFVLIMDDATILTEGLSLSAAIVGSRDNGATWMEPPMASMTWISGPDNVSKNPGEPPPRPGSGTVTIPPDVTRVKGRLVNSIAATIGADIEFI
jgi:hypothetical protein